MRVDDSDWKQGWSLGVAVVGKEDMYLTSGPRELEAKTVLLGRPLDRQGCRARRAKANIGVRYRRKCHCSSASANRRPDCSRMGRCSRVFSRAEWATLFRDHPDRELRQRNHSGFRAFRSPNIACFPSKHCIISTAQALVLSTASFWPVALLLGRTTVPCFRGCCVHKPLQPTASLLTRLFLHLPKILCKNITYLCECSVLS